LNVPGVKGKYEGRRNVESSSETSTFISHIVEEEELEAMASFIALSLLLFPTDARFKSVIDDDWL
jgi:hypothetical protein